MELVLKKHFIRQLSRMPVKIQTSVREKLDVLENAESLDLSGLNIKRMEGQGKDENYYSIRVAHWRIGIELIEPKVIVLTIFSSGFTNNSHRSKRPERPSAIKKKLKQHMTIS